MSHAHDEDWDVLQRLLPGDWEEVARRTGALKRLRGFRSVSDLLRTLLLHVGPGYSLRETSVRAKAAGLADVTDVALLRRLRAAGEWWRTLAGELFREQGSGGEPVAADVLARIRVIDASTICEPGPTGSQWRLHYSLRLPSLRCDHFEITPARGEGNGERLDRFGFQAGEIVLADRAYIHPRALEWAQQKEIGLVVRYNSGSTPLFDAAGRKWPLMARVRQLEAGRPQQWRVHVRGEQGLIPGRLCALQKSDAAAQKARKKLLRAAQRHQTQPRPETLELAGYVLLWHNLDDSYSAEHVLALYRQRWQIETAFKRLKSLAKLGHLPKRDPDSSRAWLYGKLLLALLAEKLGRIGRDFSPWGYPLGEAGGEPMA